MALYFSENIDSHTIPILKEYLDCLMSQKIIIFALRENASVHTVASVVTFFGWQE